MLYYFRETLVPVVTNILAVKKPFHYQHLPFSSLYVSNSITSLSLSLSKKCSLSSCHFSKKSERRNASVLSTFPVLKNFVKHHDCFKAPPKVFFKICLLSVLDYVQHPKYKFQQRSCYYSNNNILEHGH